MPQVQKISKNNTQVINEDKTTTVILHKTCIVVWDRNSRTIKFNTGGWETTTTVTRMNQACNEFGLPWRVSRAKGAMSARNYKTEETKEFIGNTLIVSY